MDNVADLKAFYDKNLLPDAALEDLEKNKMYILPNSTFATNVDQGFAFSTGALLGNAHLLHVHQNRDNICLREIA